MPLIPTLFVPILRVSKSKKGNGLKRGKMPVTNTQLGFGGAALLVKRMQRGLRTNHRAKYNKSNAIILSIIK